MKLETGVGRRASGATVSALKPCFRFVLLITSMTGMENVGSGRIWDSRWLRFALAIMLCVCSLLAFIAVPAQAADPATITFSLDFSGSDPEHYVISVQSDGKAQYACRGRISKDSDETESYTMEFTFSDATRAHIFDLAAQAHYFSGKIDTGNKKLAFTGAKKLSYKDGQRESSAEYNYSPVPAVQQLTTLFQGVASTLEFGRRLAHYHRYQKLALDDELKRMEVEAHSGQLSELPAVKPILQEIYDDSSVMNVVRARAQRIMEMGNAAPPR